MYLFARKKSAAVELLGPSTAQLSHQNYQKRKRTPPTPPARTASPPPTRRPQFPRERPSHLAEDHTRGRPRARRPGTSRSTPCARRRRGRDPGLLAWRRESGRLVLSPSAFGRACPEGVADMNSAARTSASTPLFQTHTYSPHHPYLSLPSSPRPRAHPVNSPPQQSF